jgi:hypothetical protein
VRAIGGKMPVMFCTVRLSFCQSFSARGRRIAAQIDLQIWPYLKKNQRTSKKSIEHQKRNAKVQS